MVRAQSPHPRPPLPLPHQVNIVVTLLFLLYFKEIARSTPVYVVINNNTTFHNHHHTTIITTPTSPPLSPHLIPTTTIRRLDHVHPYQNHHPTITITASLSSHLIPTTTIRRLDHVHPYQHGRLRGGGRLGFAYQCHRRYVRTD